jgi:hypothetical protein
LYFTNFSLFSNTFNSSSSGGSLNQIHDAATDNVASFSSLQSSQTTVYGHEQQQGVTTPITTLADMDFSTVPPDATLLPNVEVDNLLLKAMTDCL